MIKKRFNPIPLLISAVFISAISLSAWLSAAEPVPNFAAIKNIQERKQAFFRFLYPKIERADLTIMRQRFWIQHFPVNLHHTRWQWLIQRYKVKTEGKTLAQIKTELLKKVDIIPPSMALAQAANESAWGTSRFTREGRNFFGQWCFKPGCGIPPKHPQKGKGYYAVKVFPTVQASVFAYMRNINSNHAFKAVRDIRWQHRLAHQFPDGMHLVEGLINYSQRREVYVKTLKSMIRVNHLDAYDEKLKQALKKHNLPQ